MSGPHAENPITYACTGDTPSVAALPAATQRHLFALVIEHDAQPGSHTCRTCGRAHPCPVHLDARQQLADAGVDLAQALGTIWS
jgi:hypothetical protein